MAHLRIQRTIDRIDPNWPDPLAWLNKAAFFSQEWAGPAAVRH
jgi:hypothetical protein